VPLTIAAADFEAWLDPAREDPDEIRALLADPVARPLDARPVSTAVNRVSNNHPNLVDEVRLTDARD
jgi:putative SOS response-associated peptidase YedK